MEYEEWKLEEDDTINTKRITTILLLGIALEVIMDTIIIISSGYNVY
jgi:hypothetical protein